METLHVRTLEEVTRFAKDVVGALVLGETATVIALTGELGAGKTTFVQRCAETLGVRDVVTSPTFLVMKRYALKDARFETLIHIDAYRIDDEIELDVLKLRESLAHPENLVMIEWAERVPSFIPPDALWIEMALADDGSRTIVYGRHDTV